MTPLLISSFIIMFGYIAFYTAKCGWLSSHSYSYYALKPYKLSWLFYATMTTSVMMLIPVALELTPEPVKFIAFLMCAPILMVAVAANYKDAGLPNSVHMKSAFFGGAMSLVWAVAISWAVSWWLMGFVAGALAFLLNLKIKKPVTCLEYALFLYPYLILMILYQMKYYAI